MTCSIAVRVTNRLVMVARLNFVIVLQRLLVAVVFRFAVNFTYCFRVSDC